MRVKNTCRVILAMAPEGTSVKDSMHEIAESLSDEATYDDAKYALYVRMKFDKGKQDIAEGRFLTTEEAKAKLFRWRA